ncbi:non-ribosomal peptide synthetase [Legionella cardiaca]|uniref:Amino acid adenylation domain-containing protein n=1 Tax=Legionella cardiaca TaxID=1071983 RepID=A0ABY8ANH3_9GAMM|nr:non-ribosomal peptide synthetase [Legionella cardiaca]WED41801.1 amino acid adenylation domain-containing protein [Legionella cardiaca]
MESSQTLHELFELQVEKRPKSTAAVFEEHSLSYEQLNQKANQLAHYLREMGVKADTRVALCMERSIELLIVIMGILKAGGAYIPLDPSHPEERLLLILKEGDTQFLITTLEFQKKFTRYPGKTLLFDNEPALLKQKVDNPSSVVTPRNLAYVIYTSGSTGVPKGVLVEHRGVVDYALWFADYCNCRPRERIDFSSNHAFDFALTTSIVPLALGLTLVIGADRVKKDPRQYLKYLKANKVNFIKLTPSYFRVFLYEVKNKPTILPHLQKIMLAGENLSASDCTSWLMLYPKHILFNEYGPTETSVAVTLYKIDSKNIHNIGANVPIGELAPHVQSYLLNENRIPVAEGEIGELYLGGSCLARGYLNNPKLTEQSFINDPFSEDVDARLYKTGDLCRRLPTGELECIGRIDHQIKIRGFRVEPAEIENCLTKHPAIKAGVIVAFDVPQKEKNLVAYYILKNPKGVIENNELRQYMQRYLPNYMIPTAFVRMDAFPLNANEKLDRSALPLPQFTASQSYLPPRTILEKKIAELWSKELVKTPIGLHDDFFELGGHSLSAARVISTINYRLGKEVTLNDFYKNPTIAHLAALVKNAKKTVKKHKATNEVFNKQAKLPLSDFQLLLWLADTFEPKAKKLNIWARKRLEGHLDAATLTAALQAVLQKHEVLSYRVGKFRPIQYLQKKAACEIFEKSLEALSQEEKEIALQNSIQDLITYHAWPKNRANLIIRVFYLSKSETELQLCVPHIISDEVSPEIILSDLSKSYVTAKEVKSKIKERTSYRDYLLAEQYHVQEYLNRDMAFWENYLKDASLFSFSPEYIVENTKQFAYSTYTEIPKETLNQFQSFCAKNHISILDGLCAALIRALSNCGQNSQQNNSPICINRVKSTRELTEYDNIVGCFLRLEPIKVMPNQQTTLALLSQQVHESLVKTSLYQGCSNLVKLANIGTFRQQKRVREYFIKFFVWLYTTLYPASKLNPQILNLCGRLNASKGNNFLINVNVQSSFLDNFNQGNEAEFFGFKVKNIKNYQYDLLKINNLFDACFLNLEQNTPALVISANLKPAFRELIANEVIRIIGGEK